MTSGASTPAGNYRTENIIRHSQGHAHTRPCPHVEYGRGTVGASTQQVPIHQADAVLNTGAYAPAANPNWKTGREREKNPLFTDRKNRSLPPAVFQTVNYNSRKTPKALWNYSLWHKVQTAENNKSSTSSIRLDQSWLEQYLRQVSPAYVGGLTIQLPFWLLFKVSDQWLLHTGCSFAWLKIYRS